MTKSELADLAVAKMFNKIITQGVEPSVAIEHVLARDKDILNRTDDLVVMLHDDFIDEFADIIVKEVKGSG